MTWFITGAAGFIGSNLSTYLLRAGQNVVGFDNFLTGKRENIKRIQEVGGSFKFIEGDIRIKEQVTTAVGSARHVVHLAAQGSVQKSFADVGTNNEINVGGFLNVLTASAEIGVRTFVYASSCSVYGDTMKMPISESVAPMPLSPYAVSKFANELYAASLDLSFPNMRITGLRFFNIFGPWQDPAGDYAAVVPKWIHRLMSGERPILFGDGSATRDFCYVGNICRLIEKLGEGERKLPHAVYNIGTGAATNLGTLYATIANSLNQRGIKVIEAGPEYRSWRAGDIVHSLSDITKAREELGYKPAVDLTAGMEMLLKEQYKI